jgi:hypothetical protein
MPSRNFKVDGPGFAAAQFRDYESSRLPEA